MRFNQAEYAEYYQKQQVEGGYPGKLLPFIIDEVNDSRRVIDIGAGTGFFSIPLIESGHLVTAVEPSSEMIGIMKRNLSTKNLTGIEICTLPWEEWRGEFHDAAICIHSLYPMADVKIAVNLMNESARKKIIIVRDTSGMRTLSGIVREKLSLNSNRDLNSEISVTLDGLPVKWKVVNIHEVRQHLIRDINHEADSIQFQLKLDGKFKDDIINIVKNEVTTISGTCCFNSIYSDNAYIF